MTKYEKISVLARETAKRISANREEWIRYLDVCLLYTSDAADE